MPRVSIVVPTYNAGRYLAEMLGSALAQSFQDFELLLIDSASADDTIEIARGYDDPRLAVTELPFVCEGAIKRNLGIAQAAGAYIAMMDADDIMRPERLARQVAFLDANPDIHVVGSSFVLFSDAKRSYREQPKDDGVIKAKFLEVSGAGLHTPTTMVRREFLVQRSVYFPTVRAGEGQVFWNDCMKAGARFANLQEELLAYRRHESNQTVVRKDAYRTGKTPIRADLLLWFFPHLTRKEALAAALLMEEGRNKRLSDLSHGIAVLEKITQFRRCEHGADIGTVLEILRKYYKAAKRAIMQASNDTLASEWK